MGTESGTAPFEQSSGAWIIVSAPGCERSRAWIRGSVLSPVRRSVDRPTRGAGGRSGRGDAPGTPETPPRRGQHQPGPPTGLAPKGRRHSPGTPGIGLRFPRACDRKDTGFEDGPDRSRRPRRPARGFRQPVPPFRNPGISRLSRGLPAFRVPGRGVEPPHTCAPIPCPPPKPAGAAGAGVPSRSESLRVRPRPRSREERDDSRQDRSTRRTE